MLCAPQRAGQCMAASRGCAVIHGLRLRPTEACISDGASSPPSRAASSTLPGAAIVLVLGHNRSDVRPQFHQNPDAQYRDSALLVLRCVLSLRRVNTSLPIRLLVSGERERQREAVIASHGVGIVPTPPLPAAPSWASPYMRGTFSKFAALALTEFSAILLLDSDTLALRGIDHLALAPTPAAYFHFDAGYSCPVPDLAAARGVCGGGLLNSGVMVLTPSARLLRKARRLMELSDREEVLGAEGLFETSDQRLWHALYDEAHDWVHELPFGYNANADANLTRVEWGRVSILHDLVAQRRRGWGRSGHAWLVDDLNRQAKSAMVEGLARVRKTWVDPPTRA